MKRNKKKKGQNTDIEIFRDVKNTKGILLIRGKTDAEISEKLILARKALSKVGSASESFSLVVSCLGFNSNGEKLSASSCTIIWEMVGTMNSSGFPCGIVIVENNEVRLDDLMRRESALVKHVEVFESEDMAADSIASLMSGIRVETKTVLTKTAGKTVLRFPSAAMI